MKYYVLLLLTFLSLPAYPNSIVIIGFSKGNIQCDYLAGGPPQIRSTINILVNLSNRLLKAKQYKHQVHIYFEYDYGKNDTATYALGYGSFETWDDKWPGEKTEGLEIFIKDRELNISRVLSLIDFGCSDILYVKVGQYRHILDSYNARMDTLMSIPFEEVKKHFKSSDPVLLRLLNEKTFDLNDEIPHYCSDYYYQDNKFHFYDTRIPYRKWSASESKYITSDTFGNDILVLDNIFEICGNNNEEHLVFINDSVFYYIDNRVGHVQGPYKIDNVRNGRPSIRKHYYEYRPRRFILFISDFDTERKVAFFPDRGMVVQDYDSLESRFIRSIFSKKAAKPLPSKTSLPVWIPWLIAGSSLLLSTILLLRRKNKSTNTFKP